MPEPTATATLAAGAAVVPVLSVFGVSLGLRPDELLAGFGGALAAIALLDTVPSTGDTWRELIRTSLRRVSFATASAVTAAYLVPLASLFTTIPTSAELGMCFVCGVGAQRFLRKAVDKIEQKTEAL